jgi:hypothetical protein
LLDLWRINHPAPEEAAEIDAIIREGIADIKAGRGRTAEVAMAELRRKYNLSAE